MPRKKREYLPGDFHVKTIFKLRRLLDMRYLPDELAGELDLPLETIQLYMTLGCPIWKDREGTVFIHGLDFASWTRETYMQQKARPR
jgi:hypothetical protein